jgi:hypothetical protein
MRAKARPLPPAEQADWDRVKAQREQAWHALVEVEKRQEETREVRRQEAARLAIIAYPALAQDAQAREEFDIHAQRSAKLARMRAVAEGDGRTELFVRIDLLIQRENQRHEAWITAHRH